MRIDQSTSTAAMSGVQRSHGPRGADVASGNAVDSTTGTQETESLDEIAENIANGVRPQRPQGPPPGRPPAGVNEPDTEALNNVADVLGMPSEDLLSALQSGTNLADLAAQQGVAANDVLSAVKPGMVLKMRM